MIIGVAVALSACQSRGPSQTAAPLPTASGGCAGLVAPFDAFFEAFSPPTAARPSGSAQSWVRVLDALGMRSALTPAGQLHRDLDSLVRAATLVETLPRLKPAPASQALSIALDTVDRDRHAIALDCHWALPLS
jgi:hypothetical protein